MLDRSTTSATIVLLRRCMVAVVFAFILTSWCAVSVASASTTVAYVASASNKTTANGSCCTNVTTTATVAVPTGTANKDVMVATVATAASGFGSPAFTAPSGWTLLDTGSAGSGLYTYYRVAGASEPASYGWSLAVGIGNLQNLSLAVTVSTYTGNDPITPLTAGNTSTAVASPFTLPNDTAASAGSMRISAVATNKASTASTASTFQGGLTLDAQIGAANGYSVDVGMAHAAQGAGATTSYSDTLASAPALLLAATYVINPIVATKVAFATQPVGGVAEGVNFATQPTVSVQTASGAVETGDTSTVTLAIASGPAGGILSCTGGLSKTAVAGVASFAGCQITGTAGAGTYTIRATDGSLSSATSSSFVITAGSASRVGFVTQPVGGVAENVAIGTQPAVAIQDAFGNTVTGNTSSVTLAIASGPAAGVLSCTANPKAAVAGVATFAGCKITGTAAAGTYTLTATDAALTAATSNGFTIVAGAATKVVFTTQPVGGVAEGVNLSTQPVVEVQDVNGNTATGNSSSVALSIASGPGSGSFACTPNPLAASGGVATFAGCKITGTAAAGTYSLTATDGALTPATSSTFTIVVGAAAKVAFTTQPVGGVAEGVNLSTQPAVSVQDAYGNLVAGNSSSVTLSVASGPGGTITCTPNPLAASSGVATFAGCQITGTAAAGTYTLTATDGALTSATSASFTINVGAASKVGFVTQPVGGVPENVNLATQPRVSIQDAYGNTVTGNTSSVTLAIASGPGTGTFACSINPVAAAAGVATFAGCKVNGASAAGVYTLTATDGALTSATSGSFTIVAGVGTKLAFTTQPVGGVAEGLSLATQPIVSIQDAFGNTAAGDTSSATLAIASGPAAGSIACTTNPLPASSGVAAFGGCKITGYTAAGTYTLSAADGGLTGATSSSFTIVPGPPAALAFITQPVGGVGPGVNLPTQPSVGVQDAYANVVTADTSSVTLTIATGPAAGSLACGANPLAATAGVAAFAGCKVNGTVAAAGNYTLLASDGALTTATSESILIYSGVLSFTTSDYGFGNVALDGTDKLMTGTLVLDVSDTTGTAAGWRISVSAGAWTGGTTGSLSSAQYAGAQPAAATCDGGPGTCTPATPTGLTWPMAFGAAPAVLYNAAASSGMNPQTINVPMRLAIPGGVQATGTFTQAVTLSLTSGP